MNYYNEWDKHAAAWLRELIKEGHIPPGDVDERSITDVKAHELTQYTQHHFFAGIGGWSLALRLAGWPDDEPVTTGSCPCQPFSCGGLQMGSDDPRHLFPAFRKLVARLGSATVFGEQVASKLGREWLARVSVEMASLGYAVSGADLCAAGVGAPQIRQRLYWVAYADSERRYGFDALLRPENNQRREAAVHEVTRSGPASRLAHTLRLGRGEGARQSGEVQGPRSGQSESPVNGSLSRVGHPHHHQGPQGRCLSGHGSGQRAPWASSVGVCGNDGKWRRVEPGVPPLAPRLPSRVALIRGSGNAIVPELAARFIIASEEARAGLQLLA